MRMGAMPPVFWGIAFQAECSISLSIRIPSFCKTRGRAGIGNKKIRPSTEGRILVPRYHPDSWRIWLSQALYNVQTYAFPVTWKWRRHLIRFDSAPHLGDDFHMSCPAGLHQTPALWEDLGNTTLSLQRVFFVWRWADYTGRDMHLSSVCKIWKMGRSHGQGWEI